MKISDSDTHLTISLSPWEKLASFHGDLRIALHDVTAAQVEPHPMRSVLRKRKLGLHLPGYLYLASADRGRHFIALRHGEPALHLSLQEMRIREVTVSAPDAERLVRRLTAACA